MTLKCPVTVFRPIRIRKLNVGVESGYMLHMQFVCTMVAGISFVSGPSSGCA
jgi:hypothetical protein